jgi:hypothetical protein
VPAVVGPDLFRPHIQENKEDDPYTAGDEAFTLLLLKNNSDLWEISMTRMWAYLPNDGKITQRSADSDV